MYGRITGQQMANATYEFMSETLGITDENQCSVLVKEIDKVRKSMLEECAVFGWGLNSHQQLATGKGQ